MSIIFTHGDNVLLCHQSYINDIYQSDRNSIDGNDVQPPSVCANVKKCIFDLNIPFGCKTTSKDADENRRKKAKKKKEHVIIEEHGELYALIQRISNESKLFLTLCQDESKIYKLEQLAPEKSNAAAQSFLDYFRAEPTFSKSIDRICGENALPYPIAMSIDQAKYLIPPRCKFFNRDVRDLEGIEFSNTYDLIVLDPPWWNKYIRRSRKFQKEYSYEMLTNDEIKNIPIETFITPDVTLIAIWCTNAPSLTHTVLNEFLPKWKLKLIATWHWLKITKCGETIREFSLPLQKQPFEQIFIACHIDSNLSTFNHIHDGKIIYSVPSIIHSQKPPLTELLLADASTRDNINGLEIFGRYLLPNFTSIGLEVLKLQNINLFDISATHVTGE